jgi:CMP/dCMP kinase
MLGPAGIVADVRREWPRTIPVERSGIGDNSVFPRTPELSRVLRLTLSVLTVYRGFGSSFVRAGRQVTRTAVGCSSSVARQVSMLSNRSCLPLESPLMIVTIDGPAGTGKSTVARQLAERLGFDYLDTGAMYRAIAARSLAAGIDSDDAGRVAQLARAAQIRFVDGRTIIDGEDVTDQLRTGPTTEAASRVAQNIEVRQALVQQQRACAAGRDVVCEGRDQGTVAFPEAQIKFFLDAAPLVRAQRRQQELAEKGEPMELSVLLAEQTARDERDQNRAVAPLRPAEDAIVVDTTDLPLEVVVDRLEADVRQVLSEAERPSAGSSQS